MTNDTDIDETLPKELVAALRAADGSPAIITSRVDQSLDKLATQQFAGRVRARRNTGLWLAAASVVAVAVILQMQLARDTDGLALPRASLLYTDVDGSGQVDIADVMALASTGDDQYSQEELNAFAMHVVSLGDES